MKLECILKGYFGTNLKKFVASWTFGSKVSSLGPNSLPKRFSKTCQALLWASFLGSNHQWFHSKRCHVGDTSLCLSLSLGPSSKGLQSNSRYHVDFVICFVSHNLQLLPIRFTQQNLCCTNKSTMQHPPKTTLKIGRLLSYNSYGYHQCKHAWWFLYWIHTYIRPPDRVHSIYRV